MDTPTITLKDKITERIEQSGPAVREQFIDLKAKEETSSRVNALSEAFSVIDKLRKELQKIDRPDVVNVDRDGKPVGTGAFTKKRADSIKKYEDVISRWEAALGSAWGADDAVPDFKKIRELLKNPPKIEESKDE